MSTKLILSSISSLALLLAACGGDDSSGGAAGAGTDTDSGAGGSGTGGSSAGGSSAGGSSAGGAGAGGAGTGGAGTGGAGTGGAGTGGAGTGGSDPGTGGGDAGTGGADPGTGGGDAGTGGADPGTGGGDAGTGGADPGSGGAGPGGDGGLVVACTSARCSGNGTCAVVGDQTECTCDAGYAGDTCADCAPGYRTGVRVGSCVLDAPQPSDVAVWLDAAHAESFVLNSGNVVSWASRAEGDATLFTPGGCSACRPARTIPRQGSGDLPVVRFDGADDLLRRLVDLRNTSYSLFVVGSASPGKATDQIFLHGVGETNVNRNLRLVADDSASLLRFRHGMPAGLDQVEVPNFPGLATGDPTLIEAHRVTSNGSLLLVRSGDTFVSTPGTQASFDEQLLVTLGQVDGATHSALDGDIAEVLIFAPALTDPATLTRTRAYLRAKWSL